MERPLTRSNPEIRGMSILIAGPRVVFARMDRLFAIDVF
jgi:hypothetical protein